MQHMGMFDPTIDPIKPGGLTAADVATLTAAGFIEKVTTKPVHDAYVNFANAALPGGTEIRRVSIPPGTRYFYNETTGSKVLGGCGNGSGGLWGD